MLPFLGIPVSGNASEPGLPRASNLELPNSPQSILNLIYDPNLLKDARNQDLLYTQLPLLLTSENTISFDALKEIATQLFAVVNCTTREQASNKFVGDRTPLQLLNAISRVCKTEKTVNSVFDDAERSFKGSDRAKELMRRHGMPFELSFGGVDNELLTEEEFDRLSDLNDDPELGRWPISASLESGKRWMARRLNGLQHNDNPTRNQMIAAAQAFLQFSLSLSYVAMIYMQARKWFQSRDYAEVEGLPRSLENALKPYWDPLLESTIKDLPDIATEKETAAIGNKNPLLARSKGEAPLLDALDNFYGSRA